METNDTINTSLCQNAARRAIDARERARVNPNPGTLSNAKLKTLDFRRMMAKRRAARGGSVTKFKEADKARRKHYYEKHGW